MNLWNKIVLGTRFLVGGFESATDYLLRLLNTFLEKPVVAGRVQKVREFVNTAIALLKKYEKYCPAIWADEYAKLISVIQILADMFEDGRVSSDELNKAVEAVKAAIEEWMK